MQIKGILSFPSLFTARAPKSLPDSEPKYSTQLLVHKDDPQIAEIKKVVDVEIANTHPSGFPHNGKNCWGTYTEKTDPSKFNQRFQDYYVLSTTAKQDQRPGVFKESGAGYEEVRDPGEVFAGQVVWLNINIQGYTKGQGGVTAYINGALLTDEESPLGRLDERVTDPNQLFSNRGNTPAQPAATPQPNTAPPAAPAVVPQPPVPPAAAPAAPQYVMTEKATSIGQTRESMHAANWTDAMLIEQGYMLPPGGVKPSFM
jgi:hypothetical protein